MRAVLHIDVVTLARCLLAVEAVMRVDLCDRVFDWAHAADKYGKRFGVYHLRFGFGNLASACMDLPKEPEPFLSNKEYAHCLKVVFERILRRA